MEEIRDAIDQQFTEPDFIRRLHEALAPALEAAVSRALEQRDAKIAALEEKLAATNDCLATTKERLKVVERELEHVGLESRKKCLLLNGVPELPDEDIDGLVLDVAKAAGITVHAGDLDRSHRLGSQRGTIDRPRAILVKLLSHKKRQQLYSVRKELSAHRVRDHPVLIPQVLQEVFMADFLTTKKTNDSLHLPATEKKKPDLGRLQHQWKDKSSSGRRSASEKYHGRIRSAVPARRRQPGPQGGSGGLQQQQQRQRPTSLPRRPDGGGSDPRRDGVHLPSGHQPSGR